MKPYQLLLATSFSLISFASGAGLVILLSPTNSTAESAPSAKQLAVSLRVDNNVEQVTTRNIPIDGVDYVVTTKVIAGVDQSLLLNPERYQFETDVANRTTVVRVTVPTVQILDVVVTEVKGEGPDLSQAIVQALQLARSEINPELTAKANEAAVRAIQAQGLSVLKSAYPNWRYEVVSIGVSQ